MMDMMGNGGMMNMMMGGFLMVLLWLLFLALLVVGVVLLVRWLLNESNAFKKQDDALTIAQERFARGEIDADEFRTIKKELST